MTDELTGRRTGGIFGGGGLLSALLTLRDLGENPPKAGDVAANRVWLLKGLQAGGTLAKQTPGKFDDDTLSLGRKIVSGDQFPDILAYLELYFPILAPSSDGNVSARAIIDIGDPLGVADERMTRTQRRGRRQFRRLSKEERLVEAVRNLRRNSDFVAADRAGRADMVLDRMFGSERKVSGIFEDVDWEQIMAFIEWLLPLILAMFGGV